MSFPLPLHPSLLLFSPRPPHGCWGAFPRRAPAADPRTRRPKWAAFVCAGAWPLLLAAPRASFPFPGQHVTVCPDSKHLAPFSSRPLSSPPSVPADLSPLHETFPLLLLPPCLSPQRSSVGAASYVCMRRGSERKFTELCRKESSRCSWRLHPPSTIQP